MRASRQSGEQAAATGVLSILGTIQHIFSNQYGPLESAGAATTGTHGGAKDMWAYAGAEGSTRKAATASAMYIYRIVSFPYILDGMVGPVSMSGPAVTSNKFSGSGVLDGGEHRTSLLDKLGMDVATNEILRLPARSRPFTWNQGMYLGRVVKRKLCRLLRTGVADRLTRFTCLFLDHEHEGSSVYYL